jgi:hypothetical protein
VERRLAIARLAQLDLAKLTSEERAEQLEIMLCEGWEENPRWHTLPAAVRDEFTEGELRRPADDSTYDAVLLIWLSDRYSVATNEFLQTRLRASGIDADSVTGEPVRPEACPCCGYRTIGARGDYEICPVCWWEDDGQDNENADVVMGGPNYHVSLTQGRINFLREGIYDPMRGDLRKNQDPPEMYARGRVFVLTGDGRVVEEGVRS